MDTKELKFKFSELIMAQWAIGFFRYIKIQLDSEAQRTQAKEMNKHGHSISFVCVLQASLPCW